MNRRRIITLAIFILLIVPLSIYLFLSYAYRMRDEISQQYIYAQTAFDNGKYKEAISIWSKLGDYKDSLANIENANQKITESEKKQEIRETARELFAYGEYKQAADLFQSIHDLENQRVALYAYAEKLYASDYDGHLSDALTVYQELGDYKDSKLKAATISVALYSENQGIIYQQAMQHFLSKEYRQALNELGKIPDYEFTAGLREECEEAIQRLDAAESISVGIEYCVAITNTGQVVTTDENMPWQEAISSWEDVISVSCMESAIVGLKIDGQVLLATNMANVSVDEWQDQHIVAVSAGDLYIVGLRRDGTVVSQGHNGDGQRNIEDWTGIVAISTGWRHTVGLRMCEDSTNEILIAGYQSKKQLTQIADQPERWQDIIAIAAGGGSIYDRGDGHTVGLRRDGTVVAIGDNKFGQCETDSWQDVVAIAAGDWFTAGLTSRGNVLITKPSDEICQETGVYTGVLSAETWTGIVAISAGSGNIIGIDENGKIHAAGNNNKNQTTNALEWENLLVYPAR